MYSKIWQCALKWTDIMKSHPTNMGVICDVDYLPQDLLIVFLFWQKGSKKSLWRYSLLLPSSVFQGNSIIHKIDEIFGHRLFQLINTCDLDCPQFELDPDVESLQR